MINIKKFDFAYVLRLCEEIDLVCIDKEYKGIKAPMKFICSQCGQTFERNLDNLKTRRSNTCKDCGHKRSNQKQVLSLDYVKDFILAHGCVLLSESYSGYKDNLKIQCKCGKTFYSTFNSFKHKTKKHCDLCSTLLRSRNAQTPDYIIESTVNNANYKFFQTQMRGNEKYVKVQCNKLHSPYWVRFTKFKIGQRCAKCTHSKGECAINSYLKLNNISFKIEYTFKNLRGIGGLPLRFDFAVMKDDNLICLIEYDGKQHYEVGFNDKVGFLRTQKHDIIKNKYCKENNIDLLRIKYTNFNSVNFILKEFLSKYKI